MMRDDSWIRCAYCGAALGGVNDRPFPQYAQCWDCFLEEYRPPTLAWWRVAA